MDEIQDTEQCVEVCRKRILTDISNSLPTNVKQKRSSQETVVNDSELSSEKKASLDVLVEILSGQDVQDEEDKIPCGQNVQLESNNSEPQNISDIVCGPELLESDQENLENNFSEEIEINSGNITKFREKVKLLKKLKNSGKAYSSLKSNKTKSARKTVQLKKCRRNCNKKINLAQQKVLFEEYWNLGDYSLRQGYLNKLITIETKQRQTNLKNPTKIRNYTFQYEIQIDFKSIKVCKACFINIFGETPGFLYQLTKKSVSKTVMKDCRGLGKKANKISIKQEDEVNEHIKSFPLYLSHYGRSISSQKYLSPGLNISKMYELYKEKYITHVSITKFTEIFKKHNLKFKRPQVDTCHKCDVFKMKLRFEKDEEKKKEILKEQEKHHSYAETAYNSKRQDKLDPEKTVLCLDLQQILPSPFLQTSVAYYKRSFYMFNLTIKNCTSNKTTCFLWDESISGRGANEIASCIYKYFQINRSNLNHHVVIYSDTCPGQNRNSIVWAMFQVLMLSPEPEFNIKIIEHKFLEPGHTHLECDNDHAIIEKAKKNNSSGIWHPHDWKQLIRSCKKKNPFIVYEMLTTDFLHFSDLFKKNFKKTKLNSIKEKIQWREIRIIKYETENYGMLIYKVNYADIFLTANMSKKNNKVPREVPREVPQLLPLNEGLLPISKEKKKDLLDMLNLIPPIFHNFYRELKVSTNSVDNLYNYDSDNVDV